MNPANPKNSADRVQQALAALGVATSVREMPGSTRTAKDAAQAVGCATGQIAKSLVFRGKLSGGAILIIASGPNRVDEAKMAEAIGEPIERATPDFVRDVTGYAIGGVPPIGHRSELPVWMDRALFAYEVIWAAAGTPHALFPIPPADLARIAQAQVVDL